MEAALAEAIANNGVTVAPPFSRSGCRRQFPAGKLKSMAISLAQERCAPLPLTTADRRSVQEAWRSVTGEDPSRVLFCILDLDAVLRLADVGYRSLPRMRLVLIDEQATMSSVATAGSSGRASATSSSAIVSAGPGAEGVLVPMQQDTPEDAQDTAPERGSSDANRQLVLASTDDMTAEAMRELIVSLTETVHEDRRKADAARNRFKRQKEKVIKLEKLEHLQKKHASLVVPGRRPDDQKRRYVLTLRGLYTLAYKQTLGFGGIMPMLQVVDLGDGPSGETHHWLLSILRPRFRHDLD